MRVAGIAAVMGLAVAVALPALADQHAQSRESSGRGHSSSVGASHHSSSPGRSGSGSHARPRSGSRPPTIAERRHPRAGTGHGRSYGYRYGSPYGYYGGYGYGYSYPYYYYDYPYYYWGGGYGYYSYPYFYGGYRYSSRYRQGSLRLLVDPPETQVYVDGYYAGVVDDFDGIFQRLHVRPGRHEITLKLEGYREKTFRVYAPIDHTVKIHYDMIEGRGDEGVVDLSPGAPEGPPADGTYGRREPGWQNQAPPPEAPEAAAMGTLRLHVEPLDASVYVDGEFRGTGKDVGALELPVGTHRVEVVRPGFRTWDRQVDVPEDQPAVVEVDLGRP